MDAERCLKTVLDCSFKVHTALGPGLLGSANEEWLFYKIIKSGPTVQKQKPLPLIYEDVKLDPLTHCDP